MKKLIHTNPEVIESVIRACSVCFVGLADTDGTPYVVPMSFGYRDGVVYLHSSQKGRMISILERNPKVCITFCPDPQLVSQHPEVACSYSVRGRSVIGWGTVSYEEDPEKKKDALNILMNQYAKRDFHYNDPAVRNVKIWVVPLTEMTCKEFGIQTGS